jgi:hypothetical protein
VSFAGGRNIRIEYGQETEDGSILLWGQEYDQDGDASRDLVIKLHADGRIAWEKFITPVSARVQYVQPTDGNGIVLVGLDEQQGFPFTLKLDGGGEAVSQRTYSGDIKKMGEIFMRLSEDDQLAAIGSVRFSTEPKERQLIQTFTTLANGDVVVAGPIAGTTKGTWGETWPVLGGLWAARINPQDQIVWQKIYETQASPQFFGAGLRDGSLVLVKIHGSTNVSSIVRMDASGNIVYWKHYTSLGMMSAASETPDGGIILTGGGKYFMKLDAEGEVVWRREKLNSEGPAHPHYVFETRDGDLIVAARSTENGSIIARLSLEEPFLACTQVQFTDSYAGEHFPSWPLNISQSVEVSPHSTEIEEVSNQIGLEELPGNMLELCRYVPPPPTPTPHALPSPMPTEASAVYPIVGGEEGILLGGVKDGEWLDATATSELLNGGETYHLFAGGEYQGEAQGSVPETRVLGACAGLPGVMLEPEPQGEHIWAMAGTWELKPRTPTAMSPETAVYQEAVRARLEANGIADPEAAVTEILRIDLEGDGVEEVLITANRLTYEAGTTKAGAGDYALVVLRKLSGETVETIPLVEDYYFSEQSNVEVKVYSIYDLVDLNGDGTLEVVVKASGGTASETKVFEVVDNTILPVLKVGCGLGSPQE